MKKIAIVNFILFISLLIQFQSANAAQQANSGLFNEEFNINVGPSQANAPDAEHQPQSRHALNQVPEKLQFIFQGHQAMQQLGDHYVSDVQTLLRDIEQVNQNAWNDLQAQYKDEFTNYASSQTPAALASVPAGALAVGALDNAGAIAKQNLQFGIPLLFEGLGNELGDDCQGTVRGMLEGKCRWGTPPKIESAIFSQVIGDDTNLSQLNGAYEVWGVAPARATLLNLIFNQGLFQ